ncbi:MAG: hypothetical protein VYC34_11805 [Planctomycetota bacterium]|nr:hypothetical protein [Planctomycetota bacterium]
MFGFGKRNRGPVPFEVQLHILAEHNICLCPDVTPDDLLREWNPEDFESDPYLSLLLAMGGERPDNPDLCYSDDIFWCDTECIEDHGDYARIARRMSALTRGALVFDNLRDYVDVEEQVAWIEAEIDGDTVRYEARVDDDWLDPDIFIWFDALLRSRPGARRYTYIDLGGQDCLLGCCTPAQLAPLRRATGLDIQWLI